MPIEALTTAGCVLIAMICYTCGSVVRVFHAQPEAGSELTSASLLVSPCAGVSCLVGTRNTLHIGSDERGQSRIGCHRWVASTSRLCQLAKCSRFSSPRTEPPITDSVCSLGRDEVVWSSLTSAVVSLQGHRLIWLVACATVSIGWFGELVNPIGHLSSSVVSWLKD